MLAFTYGLAPSGPLVEQAKKSDAPKFAFVAA